MLEAYLAAGTGQHRTIRLEIDFIGNETGIDKELPTDLSQYARSVVEKIGEPFETYRTWPSIVGIPRPAGSTLPLVQNDRPKPPPPDYRLVGSLLRASERLAIGRDARADGLFGNGHGQSDVQLTGEHRRTITSYTLGLTLETPEGIAVRGATIEAKINVERSELNRSISVYVGGSGLGGGTKAIVTQDTGDALYDAMALTVIHVLGNALRVPYYRCDANFGGDETLDGRVRDSLNRLTRTELERYIKRYMYVGGFTMDMREPDLVETDRAIAMLEMRRRSLDTDNRNGLVEFVMQLWKDLDYVQASKRVAAQMAQNDQGLREEREREMREQSQIDISPMEFGWSPSVRVVVLDLSRVGDIPTKDEILAAVRVCVGCDEIRAHPTKTVVGIRISSQPSEVQRALRSSSLRLEYVWFNSPSPRLLVVPATQTDPIRG